MNTKTLTFIAAGTAFLGSATLWSCAQNNGIASSVPTEVSAQNAPSHSHAKGEEKHDVMSAMPHTSTVHTHSTRLVYSSVPPQIQAGKPATMTLRIVDKTTGKPVNDFDIVHAKKLHFIVVSSDLQFFNHIHPQLVGDGKFQIKTTLPTGGTYRLYADYKPRGEEGEVALQEIEVAGAKPISSTRLTPDAMKNGWLVRNVTSHDEGLEPTKNAAKYQVALMPMPFPIAAKEDVMLHFQVRDANGKPLAKLEPYLGAQGHCVILQPNAQTYLHTHPLDSHHQMEGMKMSAPSGENSASEVMFHTNFPSAGLYKIWGQFKHNGKIISAPFVVKVGAEKAATSSTRSDVTTSVSIPANAQKVDISLPEGYKKGAATVKAGTPVALTFTLKSEASCGDTIVVPSANNWRKTLKIGESATVVYTPTKSGTLDFSCGMNMLKGSIVVQ